MASTRLTNEIRQSIVKKAVATPSPAKAVIRAAMR